jgi:hypothetical protein
MVNSPEIALLWSTMARFSLPEKTTTMTYLSDRLNVTKRDF